MKNYFLPKKLGGLTMLALMSVWASGAFAQAYCIPDYTTGTIEEDYCDVFELGDIYNPSGLGAEYNDFTAMSTNLTLGLTYTANITNTPTWGENYELWIDYNQDGDFYDAGESCGSVNIPAAGSGSITFTVPYTALGGSTRMRLRCIYGGIAPYDPCGTYSFGETEDYSVMIEGYTNDVGVVAVTNPVSGTGLGLEDVIVTVQNFGSAEASGFSVYYQVDGGLVTGGFFPGTIAPYSTASYTMPEGWDFSEVGCYDINAWTDYELDENTDNDLYNTTVCHLGPITGTGSVYIYSNVYGGAEPWYSTNNTTAMTNAFGAEGTGWTRDYFETVNVLTTFGPDNCFIFLEGSDAFAGELETFLSTNMDAIQNWVSSGGHLLLNAAPNEGDGMSFGFGGVSLNYAYYTTNATASDPAHPIFNGPFLPAGTDYTGTSFAHATVSGGGITPVMADAFAPSNVVLAEKEWGDGRVMFGGMTTSNWHSPVPNADNLRANIVSYLGCVAPAICEIPSGLYADGITTNDAVLHWNDVEGADQYRVTLQNTATGLIKTRGYYTNSVEIVDKLTPLTTYAFRVKTVCYDDLGMISSPSPWYYFTTLGRIGEDASGSIVLYPNPNSGTFNIELQSLEGNVYTVSVLDALGQQVYTQQIDVHNEQTTVQVTLNDIAAGVYHVVLYNDAVRFDYPFVMNK